MNQSNHKACISVDPGICGFSCTVCARSVEKRSVAIEISGSECKQIGKLAEHLEIIGLKELFMPLTQNPVYKAAQASGCHASCVIPAAVLKAAEVAMGMAVARPVQFSFDGDKENV
ncbi:MAG: hypothetical protein LJE96_08165 [Deltaproteobacteria bacterium]|nr:hypothetical protein [Deltaproteobacteria bacterium]